jgi:hypothetical protein
VLDATSYLSDASIMDYRRRIASIIHNILHSPFDLLPSSSQGRFAASQAVWWRYGGGMVVVWGRYGGDPMKWA